MTLHSVADELFPFFVPEVGIVVNFRLNLIKKTALVLEIELSEFFHVF